jgi:hypothetical protein
MTAPLWRTATPGAGAIHTINRDGLKLKAHLRARAIRAIDALWQAISDICSFYPPTECHNYVKAAG